MDESLNELGESIVGALPGAVSGYTVALGELTIHAEAAAIVSVLTMLRDDPRFLFVNFTDLAGVDYPARPKRFDVVWHLLSPKFNRRIRVKVQTDEATPVPSTISVYPASTVASFSFLTPILALLLGSLLFGETIGPAILLAAALAAAGIVLINRPATPRR